MARPMPRPPPVTSATRSTSSPTAQLQAGIDLGDDTFLSHATSPPKNWLATRAGARARPSRPGGPAALGLSPANLGRGTPAASIQRPRRRRQPGVRNYREPGGTSEVEARQRACPEFPGLAAHGRRRRRDGTGADAAIKTHPDWVICMGRQQAERIMDSAQSRYYHPRDRLAEAEPS